MEIWKVIKLMNVCVCFFSTGWAGSYSVAQTDLEFIMCPLSLSPSSFPASSS